MSKAKIIDIKEDVKHLIKLKKERSTTVVKRLLMLIDLKKSKASPLSKRVLAKRLGVDPNSITAWKMLYEQNGITGILSDKRIGFKPSVISADLHSKLETKLNNPNNGIRGYKELVDWVKEELEEDIKYITLLKYSKRHFGSKIKVASYSSSI